MPSSDHYVIIGNGPAGNHAAAQLRKKDGDARITIVSDELIPYYYKPRLTGFIADRITREKLLVTSLESYAEKKIRVRLGQKVRQIDVQSKTLIFDHMETLTFSKLIIATGAGSRILPSMEPFQNALKFVTSYDEVMEYKGLIQNARDFFIFGGDFVGFRFLHMLKSMGKNVTMMIYPHAFWPYALTEEMTEQIVENLSGMGVEVIVHDDILRIDGRTGAFRIETKQGIEKIVDMVFSFNGMTPNVAFAKGCGLDIDYGILVDEYLRTNIPDIFACGSCAQIYNPSVKNYTATIGWPNAAAQGEVAAANLLGGLKTSESVGRKYFDLEGVKIKTTWWDETDISESPDI